MPRHFCKLFSLIILTFSCSDKRKIDKDLVYSTLNEVFQQDSIFPNVVCIKFDQVTIPDVIQQEFFETDKHFIKKQLRNTSTAMVDTGRLFFYSRRKRQTIKSFVDTNCSKGLIYRLTYPIFSKDLQTVVIGVTEDCNGFLCGWGFKAVYKRRNGKWIKVKEYDRWIS